MLNQILFAVRNNMASREDAIGVVEVILILLVLVGLVLIFKNQIQALATSIFKNINTQVDGI